MTVLLIAAAGYASLIALTAIVILVGAHRWEQLLDQALTRQDQEERQASATLYPTRLRAITSTPQNCPATVAAVRGVTTHEESHGQHTHSA